MKRTGVIAIGVAALWLCAPSAALGQNRVEQQMFL